MKRQMDVTSPTGTQSNNPEEPSSAAATAAEAPPTAAAAAVKEGSPAGEGTAGAGGRDRKKATKRKAVAAESFTERPAFKVGFRV